MDAVELAKIVGRHLTTAQDTPLGSDIVDTVVEIVLSTVRVRHRE